MARTVTSTVTRNVMKVVILVFTRRHSCVAQNECKTPVHGRQHEARRNERAQQWHADEEQYCPPGFPGVPHPSHFFAKLQMTTSAYTFEAGDTCCHFFKPRAGPVYHNRGHVT